MELWEIKMILLKFIKKVFFFICWHLIFLILSLLSHRYKIINIYYFMSTNFLIWLNNFFLSLSLRLYRNMREQLFSVLVDFFLGEQKDQVKIMDLFIQLQIRYYCSHWKLSFFHGTAIEIFQSFAMILKITSNVN